MKSHGFLFFFFFFFFFLEFEFIVPTGMNGREKRGRVGVVTDMR